MPKPVCFVIQPMDPRSDFVYEWYFKEALRDEFDVVQPGTEPSSSITADIFKHLTDDDLVVAFLKSPNRIEGTGNHWHWNPNVMIEAGYRMGLKKPILFVREKRVQDNEPILPFDLFDISVIELVTPDEEREGKNRKGIVERVRDYAHTLITREPKGPETVTVFPFPALTMAFGGVGGKITAASDDAAAFLRYPPETKIVGLDAGKFVDKLTSELVPSQRKAFADEQSRLFGIIMVNGEKPFATVCMVFGKDAIQPGGKFDHAFLPMITRFSAATGRPTVLDVIYQDVTAAAVAGKDGVVRCHLSMASPQVEEALAR